MAEMSAGPPTSAQIIAALGYTPASSPGGNGAAVVTQSNGGQTIVPVVGSPIGQTNLTVSNSGQGSDPSDVILALAVNASQTANAMEIRRAATRLAAFDSLGGLRLRNVVNGRMGTAVLVAGTVTVANTSVTATSRIILVNQAVGGTIGILSVGAITAGTSFVINSSNALDTSTVLWILLEDA